MRTKLGIFTIMAIISLVFYKIFFYQPFFEILSNSKISVGENVPIYSAMIDLDTNTISKHNIPSGKFYVYLISSSFPGQIPCLDLKCGKQIKIIRNLGGRFQGITDPKQAKLVFGVKQSNDSPNLLYSLLVISNQKGVIIKMFKNVSINDIPTIIKILKEQNFLLTLN